MVELKKIEDKKNEKQIEKPQIEQKPEKPKVEPKKIIEEKNVNQTSNNKKKDIIVKKNEHVSGSKNDLSEENSYKKNSYGKIIPLNKNFKTLSEKNYEKLDSGSKKDKMVRKDSANYAKTLAYVFY